MLTAAEISRRYYERHKTQRNAASNARYARLLVGHVALIASLKNGKSCTDCLRLLPAACMEFDHIGSDKIRSIGSMRNWAEEKILAEVAKCELVCCNCHRVRTHARRPKMRTYKAQSMLNRNLAFHAWMHELKAAPCTDCGKIFPPVAMDWDHVRGVKVKAISQMWGWNRERILVELAKCELVCANCHRIRTVKSPSKITRWSKTTTTSMEL